LKEKELEETEWHARLLYEFLLTLKISRDKENALVPNPLQLCMSVVPLLGCGFNYTNVSQWLSNSS